MSRDLPHLVSQVFNTPLMIHGEKLDTILSAVGPRILTGQEVATVADLQPAADAGGPGEFAGLGYLAGQGIAVLPVLGTLVRRGSFLDSLSGMTSYARISSSLLEMMAHPSVRGVMLEIDSYGGEAGGVFDLVAEMADASGQYDKPIWASVNETAASAGYAIACAAENVWLPQMGAVGSVGVVTAHVDMSKADAAMGLKWTYVFNGDHKVDGNPHEPLPADVKARVQADVDDIAAKFHDLVATARGMTVETVRATEAGMFRGAKAIEAGFADNLGTLADAMNAFAEHLANPGDNLSFRSEQETTAMRRNRFGTTTQEQRAAETADGWKRSIEAVAERRGRKVAPDAGGAIGSTAHSAGWDAALNRVVARRGVLVAAPR